MNINTHSYKISKSLEIMKWLCVLMLFILSIFINYYYYSTHFLNRIFLASIPVIFAIGITFYTKIGKYIFSCIYASKKEMKKIIWPQYKETLYTTFIVISVTILISLILWGLDSIIFRLITFIISLRF